jgi:hypothetical protein
MGLFPLLCFYYHQWARGGYMVLVPKCSGWDLAPDTEGRDQWLEPSVHWILQNSVLQIQQTIAQCCLSMVFLVHCWRGSIPLTAVLTAAIQTLSSGFGILGCEQALRCPGHWLPLSYLFPSVRSFVAGMQNAAESEKASPLVVRTLTETLWLGLKTSTRVSRSNLFLNWHTFTPITFS